MHVLGVGNKERSITGLLPFEVNRLVDTCEGMNAFKAFSYFRWMQSPTSISLPKSVKVNSSSTLSSVHVNGICLGVWGSILNTNSILSWPFSKLIQAHSQDFLKVGYMDN